jgi:peptide/nickel transport system substrate-binding protein
MDNRFTLKDFIFAGLLVVVLAAIALNMWQFSYQERRLTDIKGAVEQLDGHQRDQLAVLERIERNGLRVNGVVSATATGSAPQGQIRREKRPDGSQFVISTGLPESPRNPRSKPDYARGDWLVTNIGSEPAIIAPFIYKDLYGMTAQQLVLESMTSLNLETWEQDPFLAESYEISADGKTFTFVLRKDLRWSDGKPLTADDVVFTFKVVKDPKIDAASLRSYLGFVTSCEKKDDRTVVIKSDKLYFKSLEIVGGISIIPKHIYDYKDAEEFNNRNALLVGSGPYTLEKWETGQQLIYTRNDNYWGLRPTFDQQVYKFIKNPQASLQEFLAGKLDAFDADPDQYEKYADDPEFKKKFVAMKYPTPQSGYSFVGWNLAKPQFRDKETRQAITMLINRDAIIDTLLKKMAIPTSGPFAPQSPQYNQSCQPWPYDPEGAKRLLAQAGWRLNSNGVLARDGVEFKFDLSYGTGRPLAERTANYIAEQLKSAGIIMGQQPYEFSVLMQRVDDRNFDAMMMGWSASIESDPYQVFHSSQMADKGDNAISFKNAEADRIIEQAREEIDRDKRMALWQQFHKIMHDEQPYTFLYSRMERVFFDGRFRNTDLYKTGINSEDWYVPGAQQKYK